MAKCTGTLNFQCQSGGKDKVPSLGVCVKCYAYARANRKAYNPATHRTVAQSPWDQKRQANTSWKLGTIAFDPQDKSNRDAARDVGREIYNSLTNKITTNADTSEDLLSEVSAMVGLLNDAATVLLEKNKTSECVAVCLVGVTLIIGANNALAAHAGTIADIVKTLNEKILDSPVSRVILLGAAAPAVYDCDTNGILTASLQVPPPLDQRVNIHAEIRILELLHLTMQVNQGVIASNHNSVVMNTQSAGLGWWDYTQKIYLGVDRPCCAKCYTTITAYNAGNFLTPYTFLFRGYHKMYPFEWRLPQGLRMLRTTIEYNKLKYATTA